MTFAEMDLEKYTDALVVGILVFFFLNTYASQFLKVFTKFLNFYRAILIFFSFDLRLI